MRNVRYSVYQEEDFQRLKQARNMAAVHQACRNDHIGKGRKEAAESELNEMCRCMQLAEKLEDKIIADRKAISASMLKCFLCAYMAYAYAFEFEAEIKKRTGKIEEDLHKDIKELVDKAAEIGLTIDRTGNDRHQDSFYDLSVELEDWFESEVRAKVDAMIEEYSQTKQFDKLY